MKLGFEFKIYNEEKRNEENIVFLETNETDFKENTKNVNYLRSKISEIEEIQENDLNYLGKDHFGHFVFEYSTKTSLVEKGNARRRYVYILISCNKVILREDGSTKKIKDFFK